MKAFVGTDVPGVGYLKDVPKPKPGPGQVLVKVLAAAQNTAECECATINSPCPTLMG